MSHRQKVPVALHHELSEYASLLRAIRANSTLDLVPQLRSEGISWAPRDYNGYDDSTTESEQQEEENEEEDQVADKTYILDEENDASSSKKVTRDGRKLRQLKRKRENDELRTRWPLLPDQCPQPEWTFEEEITAIADKCLRAQNAASQSQTEPGSSAAPDRSDSDHWEELQDITPPPAYIKGLSLNMAMKLSRMLSLLAHHRLDATWTKHNRAAPMSWQDILDIAGISGVFDVSIIEAVQERMEKICGPSGSQVVHRMNVLEQSNQMLADAIANLGGDFLDVEPPVGYYPKKRRQGSAELEGEEKEAEVEHDPNNSNSEDDVDPEGRSNSDASVSTTSESEDEEVIEATETQSGDSSE